MGLRFTECRGSVQYFLDPGRYEIGIGVGISTGEDVELCGKNSKRFFGSQYLEQDVRSSGEREQEIRSSRGRILVGFEQEVRGQERSSVSPLPTMFFLAYRSG